MKLKFNGNRITVAYKGKEKTFNNLELALLFGMGYGSDKNARERYNKAQKEKKNAL